MRTRIPAAGRSLLSRLSALVLSSLLAVSAPRRSLTLDVSRPRPLLNSLYPCIPCPPLPPLPALPPPRFRPLSASASPSSASTLPPSPYLQSTRALPAPSAIPAPSSF
eukprot:731571-Pleurochrysis_carterae.AAC.1